MSTPLILASASSIRRQLLLGAGVEFTVLPAQIDEKTARIDLAGVQAGARRIAETLAQAKAHQVSQDNLQALVIGCDQVLECEGEIFAKPANQADAIDQLRRLAGRQHRLFSAVAVYQNGQAQWSHVGTTTMHMRSTTPQYRADYVTRNWGSIRHSVGCYKLEEEGARLFSRVEGDYFTVLGLPLVELLGYLTDRGVLPG